MLQSNSVTIHNVEITSNLNLLKLTNNKRNLKQKAINC
jgi:hypothetical protein